MLEAIAIIWEYSPDIWILIPKPVLKFVIIHRPKSKPARSEFEQVIKTDYIFGEFILEISLNIYLHTH